VAALRACARHRAPEAPSDLVPVSLAS
jgi:hypothetical protein